MSKRIQCTQRQHLQVGVRCADSVNPDAPEGWARDTPQREELTTLVDQAPNWPLFED